MYILCADEIFSIILYYICSLDIPIYTSTDLLNWKQVSTVFHLSHLPSSGDSIQLSDGYYYCGLWAPEIRIIPQGYIVTFTAVRFHTYQSPCPPYNEDSGIYSAMSKDNILGPYIPLPAFATDTQYCSYDLYMNLPYSPLVSQHDCLSNRNCNNTMRLDSDLFYDKDYNEYWLSYSWYSNSEPMNEFDIKQLGEHVSIIKLNQTIPYYIHCGMDDNTTKIWVASPHDTYLYHTLQHSCIECSNMLAFNKGRYNEDMVRSYKNHINISWGVSEGSMIFKRSDYYYILMSQSAWDSAYYSVFYIAAKNITLLSNTNFNRDNNNNNNDTQRLIGRFILPHHNQSYGHGTAVLSLDGINYVYIHHHLNHSLCESTGRCKRNIWMISIMFEDRGDGLGDVWIKEILPHSHDEIQDGNVDEEDQGHSINTPDIRIADDINNYDDHY